LAWHWEVVELLGAGFSLAEVESLTEADREAFLAVVRAERFADIERRAISV
jgi:hypothetical protein